MKIINYLFIAAVLFSGACATMKGKTKMVTVTGKMLVEQPVCDGENKTKGDAAAIPEAEYYLKAGTTKNDQAVIATKVFKTDDKGNFSIKLEPGTYAVLYTDKMLPFAEFKLKHEAKSTYFKNRDERCFEKWYESADFILNVSKDTLVTFVVKSRCYTKTNPCWQYTGAK